jgi:hypothetical protein
MRAGLGGNRATYRVLLEALAPYLRALARRGMTRTGALAGLMAGGLGAAFYAAHCPDDSPLFVAVWYGIAVTFMMALGAPLRRRILRW